MSDHPGSIPMDEPSDHGFDGSDDAADAFLSHLKGERPALPSDRPEAPQEPEETPAGPAETKPAEEPAEPAVDPNDPDEQEIEVKVGEEVKKAKLKELKRLFGQEAALTQKSQKVSETLKAAEQREQHAHAALTSMLGKAEARLKEYEGLDMLVLSQRMDTDQFQALRQDMAAAEADVKFFKEELGGLVKAAQERTQTAIREAAAACHKVLSDPEKGIKGWGKELYQEMCEFGAKHGAPAIVNLTDPAAWRIVHMAMQYEKQQSAAASAEKKATPDRQKAHTVIVPKGQARAPADAKSTAMRNLRASGGTLDAAADAFMAR